MNELQLFQEAFVYDAEGGGFTWRHRPERHFNSARSAAAWNGRFSGKPTGCDNGAGYITLRLNNRSYKAHRVAWLLMTGAWPTLEIDHINQNPSDNCWRNLRQVSRVANQQNQRYAQTSNKSTGLLGAYADPATGRFRASIRHEGKSLYLGQFNTAQRAHEAYVEAKRRLHEGCTL
jgi:hypothetical protein